MYDCRLSVSRPAQSILRYPDKDVIENGIRFVARRQLPNGDWPQVDVNPVESCVLFTQCLPIRRG